MTDGVAVQEEEEVIDDGVEGYAPGLRGCSSTVTLSGIQIITTSQLIKTSNYDVL